jgi:membrane fusion protein, macrolide-specific efflux system
MQPRSRRIAISVAGVVTTLLIISLVIPRQHTSGSQLSAPIQRGTINQSVYGIGTVTSGQSFLLKTGVTSTLRKLYVKEGEEVRRGQRLVSLDGPVVFTAPFNGTITALPMKEGETVFPQTVILNLVDLLDRYVIVSLEQRAAIRVRRRQTAKLSFENLRDQSYSGTVASVYSNEGNFLVRIDVPNLPPQILPGMTADVAVIIDQRQNVVLIPSAAIENGQVRVKRGDKSVTSVAVQTGIADGDLTELASGDVREGDRLLLPVANP